MKTKFGRCELCLPGTFAPVPGSTDVIFVRREAMQVKRAVSSVILAKLMCSVEKGPWE